MWQYWLVRQWERFDNDCLCTKRLWEWLIDVVINHNDREALFSSRSVYDSLSIVQMKSWVHFNVLRGCSFRKFCGVRWARYWKKKNRKRTNYPHLLQFSFWFVAEKGTATLSSANFFAKCSCLVLDNFIISNKGRWVWVARGVGIEYRIFINNTLLSLLSLYLIKSKMNCSTSRGHWECTFLTVAIATGSVYVDKIWFIKEVWINQMQEFLLDNFLIIFFSESTFLHGSSFLRPC